MLDSIYITYKLHFGREIIKILPSFMQHYMGDITLPYLICKPLVVYGNYCMALYHSQTRCHVRKLYNTNSSAAIL